jgi:hypothetical protein
VEQCYDNKISQKENTTCSNWDAEPGSLIPSEVVRGSIFLIHKLLPYKGAPLSKNIKKELEDINIKYKKIRSSIRS